MNTIYKSISKSGADEVNVCKALHKVYYPVKQTEETNLYLAPLLPSPSAPSAPSAGHPHHHLPPAPSLSLSLRHHL